MFRQLILKVIALQALIVVCAEEACSRKIEKSKRYLFQWNEN